MRTLIKDGTVVTASDTFAADVWIENGKIAALVGAGHAARHAPTRRSTRTGKYVIPGGIDAHTHMDMPFGGTTRVGRLRDRARVAAAHGGTTTIVDFAIQTKGGSLRAGLDTWHAQGRRARRAIDYGFHMIMTDVNAADARGDGRDRARGRHRRSRCSWPIRACSSSTTSRSSAACCAPASSAR